MSTLALQIERYVREQSAMLCGRPDQPASVQIESRGPIHLATLGFSNSQIHRLVIKPMSKDAKLSDPAALMRVQESLRARGEAMAQQLVPVLDADPARRWIVMPLVPGRTLEQVLRSALHGKSCDATLATNAIAQIAHRCAAMHQVRAVELGLFPQSQANVQYLPAMDRVWHHRLMQRALPCGTSSAQLHEMVCGNAFADRVADRVVPVDVQPKNQIVDDAGHVTFIDPDYVAGHPAITLATFLVGLDRLTISHPGNRSAKQVERWKRLFLRAYAVAGLSWVTDDLHAFYPWVLVRVYEAHAQARPWARPYLAYAYRRVLARFTRQLAKHGRAWSLPKDAAPAQLHHAA